MAGRSPGGSGSRPSGRAADGVSPVPASIPNADAWHTEHPPFGRRPIWQYVWVQGECYHSGTTWFRQGWGTASIRLNDAEDGFQGYRASDIERICRDNDIDPISADVVGWLPMTAPALLDGKTRSRLLPCDDSEWNAQAIEARRAETLQDGSVHESAVGTADAPNPGQSSGMPKGGGL